MPEFAAPVADQNLVTPQSVTQTLSTMMGMRRQKAEIKSAQAQAQIDQQNAAEQAAAAHFIQNYDPDKHLDNRGVIDLNGLAEDPNFKALGSHAPAMWTTLTGLRGQQIQNIQALSTLDKDTREQLGQGLGQFGEVPEVTNDTPEGRKMVMDYLQTFGEQGPEQKRIADMWTPTIINQPKGKLQESISRMQLQAMAAGEQNAAQSKRLADTGGNLVDTSRLSQGGGGYGKEDTQGFEKTLSPEQRIAYQAEKQGAVAQTESNFANINSNRIAATAAPQQLNQINNALKLSEQTSTGYGAGERAKLESGISALIPGFDKLQDDATKVNTLNKFLARITTDSEKVLGASAQTDAMRESVAQQNAQIGYTPEAIRNVLKYAQAQTMAMQAKGNAQEEWLKKQGNNITNQQDFETSWRQAYDPVIFQLQAASSQAEQKKIIDGLSPDEAKSLAAKRSQLKALGVPLE